MRYITISSMMNIYTLLLFHITHFVIQYSIKTKVYIVTAITTTTDHVIQSTATTTTTTKKHNNNLMGGYSIITDLVHNEQVQLVSQFVLESILSSKCGTDSHEDTNTDNSKYSNSMNTLNPPPPPPPHYSFLSQLTCNTTNNNNNTLRMTVIQGQQQVVAGMNYILSMVLTSQNNNNNSSSNRNTTTTTTNNNNNNSAEPDVKILGGFIVMVHDHFGQYYQIINWGNEFHMDTNDNNDQLLINDNGRIQQFHESSSSSINHDPV